MTADLTAAQPDRLSAHATRLARLVGHAVHPDGGFGWLDPWRPGSPAG